MAGQKRTQQQLHHMFEQVMNYLRNSEIPLILFYGSLLGFYRDACLVEGDDDIDVLMQRKYVPHLLDYFKKNPSEQVQILSKRDDIIQLKCGDIHPFDIYMIDVDQTRQTVSLPWEKEEYLYSEIFPAKVVPFLGCKVYIPNNCPSVLWKSYGKKWRIPLTKEQCYVMWGEKKDEKKENTIDLKIALYLPLIVLIIMLLLFR